MIEAPTPEKPHIITFRDRVPNYPQTRENLLHMSSLTKLIQSAQKQALQGFAEVAKVYMPQLSTDDSKVYSVLEKGDYQSVSPESEQYHELHQAKSLYQKTIRDIITDIISDPEASLQLSHEQKITLRFGLQIQNLTDDIDLAWHKELVQGKDAREIKEKMKDETFAREVIGQHGDFIYGIVRKAGDTYEYLTYAKAFAPQVKEIAQLIDGMVEELTPLAESGSEEAKILIDVHIQLKTLLTLDGEVKDNIAQRQEEEARKLDTLWVTKADPKKMSIDILYPMETYAAGKFVEWQYDVLVKEPEYDDMNLIAEKTKMRMYEDFKTDVDFQTLPTLQKSLAILEPTQAVVYLRLPSGSTLRFRSAASNVPNRPEVRLGHDRPNPSLANGSKINFDYQTFVERDEVAQPLREKVFGRKRSEEIFGDTKKVILLLLETFVAGHEDAHNLLERTDTLKTMGTQLHIELDEVKADLASLFTCFKPNYLSHVGRKYLAKSLFTEELRGLSRWSERDTDRAHLNGNIMILQLMMDTKVLSYNDNIRQWEFNANSDRKLKNLSKKAKRKLLELAKVYEATQPAIAQEKGEAFKREHYNNLSSDMLRLLKDAGIIDEKEYAQELMDAKNREKHKKLDWKSWLGRLSNKHKPNS